MEHDSERRSKSGGAIVAAIVLVAMLPLFYVLSLGPAAWLADHGYINGDEGSAAAKLYFPLAILGENVPLLGDLLEAYMSLFT